MMPGWVLGHAVIHHLVVDSLAYSLFIYGLKRRAIVCRAALRDTCGETMIAIEGY